MWRLSPRFTSNASRSIVFPFLNKRVGSYIRIPNKAGVECQSKHSETVDSELRGHKNGSRQQSAGSAQPSKDTGLRRTSLATIFLQGKPINMQNSDA